MTTLHNAARRGFTKSSTTYKCSMCTRLTRSTGNGDNENVKLCVQCWDIAGIENGLEDGIYETPEAIAEAEAELSRLRAVVAGKVAQR